MNDTKRPYPVWITDIHASEILGVQPRTLVRWAKRGVGPQRFRIGLKFIRYDKFEVVEYLQNLPEA